MTSSCDVQSSACSAARSLQLVSGRLRRTGCRGVAQPLRARLLKHSKTAGPRSTGGCGDADLPIFDRTHLREKKESEHPLARECRAGARRGHGDFELAALTYIKAGQRRCRWAPDQRADGGHASDALGARMRTARPLHVSRSRGPRQRSGAHHVGGLTMAGALMASTTVR